jgi:hypothetical protein
MSASGQARSRGKRRLRRETPSRVTLVAAARACSCVHPLRLLYYHAHRFLPRGRDVLGAGTLFCRQGFPCLVPYPGEGPLHVGHRRSEHAHGGVPVGKPRLRGADQPAVGDAHPSRRGVLPVHGEQLAVVAPDRPERRN